MRYTFLGKPDKTFPDLITGQVYDLEIVVRNAGWNQAVFIVKPFFCPYLSWALFHQNWLHFNEYATSKPVKHNKKKITNMERGQKKSYLEKFPLSREEEEMFKESKRLEIKHPSEFVITKEQYQRAEKSRKHLLYTIRQESAREKRVTLAYYLFFLALLYAVVILSCVPR